LKPDSELVPSNSFMFTKSEPIEEPCPCSSLRSFKDPLISNPTDIINKILMSNNLFSNKEPISSTLCCESHEHDDFITFEFGPKHTNAHPIQSNLPGLPFIFESFLPRKPLIQSPSSKTKALEIFLLPKKKESTFIPLKKELTKKDSIQLVGDKELRNDFKNLKFRPSLPVFSSVKKDLTAQEKNEVKKPMDKNEIEQTTISSLNALK
jgi:hypothetical protein